jgi:hypothetical protein
MSNNNYRRLEHLEQEHHDLDKMIDEEFRIYGNDALVNTLKKKKLKIKDEIEHLKNNMLTEGN